MKEIVEVVERLTEAQVRELADKMGISFIGLEGDLKRVFTKIQKKWLAGLAMEAKVGKSQKRGLRESKGGGERRNGQQEREGQEDQVSL